MYCQRCGAVLEEGVRFCQKCGTRVEAPEPAYAQPEEPAYQPPAAKGFRKPSTSGFQEPAAPTYEQPAAPAYEQPAAPVYDPFAAQAYEQPAAPVYDPFAASAYEQPAAPAWQQPYAQQADAQPPYAQGYAPVSAPAPRKALLLPAIFAIIHTLYALIGWSSILITQIPDLIRYIDGNAYFGYLIFQNTLGPMLDIAAGVFLFLFCLVQYRKGKTSMLGVCCLLEAIDYGLGLLSYPAAAILSYDFSFTAISAVYILLYLAIIAMLVINMIFAFKGTVRKIPLLIAALVMILMQIVVTVVNCISYSYGAENVLRQILYFLLNTLLPVALLLVAILWKPFRTE